MAHIGNKTGMPAGMMKEMMGPGKMGPGMMKGMMGSGMGTEAAQGAAKVVIVSVGSRSSHGFLGRLIRNPAVLIGLGIVTGYMIHKSRKEIVSDTSKTE